jgi:hypothetical protein
MKLPTRGWIRLNCRAFVPRYAYVVMRLLSSYSLASEHNLRVYDSVDTGSAAGKDCVRKGMANAAYRLGRNVTSPGS